MVASHDTLILCISAFTTAKLLSMTLHGGVQGFYLKHHCCFHDARLQAVAFVSATDEWRFNHLRVSSSPSSSSSCSLHLLFSIELVVDQRSRAGGESREREPRSRASADGRPAATYHQHAHPGQVRRGRVYGWYHGRGQLRWWGQHWLRASVEIPIYETSVSWTVPGWDRVLCWSHSPAHPHPEGNQEITVGHRIRWVSKPVLKAALTV